jgi:hypothetical protein
VARGVYSDSSTEDLTQEATWSSSDTAVATISSAAGSHGLATGVEQGTSTISASIDDLSGSTELVVSPPLVTVTGVELAHNKRHLIDQVTIDFSGPVEEAQADNVATYRLLMPGKKNSFNAKNAAPIKLLAAVYDAALTEVALTPKQPFALRRSVQVTVYGVPPAGLHDTLGRLIDGSHDGKAGGNAVAVLRAKGVILDAESSFPDVT